MHTCSQLRQREIVCVGFADWDADLWTNQQHLMSRLARDNRVLFVESLGLRQPQLAGRDLTRIARRAWRGVAPPRERDGLHILSPLVVPFHRFGMVRRMNAGILSVSVTRAARGLAMKRPILWAYVPQAEAIVDALDPAIVVYHCVDDMAAQAGIDATSFRAAEQRFAARADLVIASSPALAQRMRTLADNVFEAPNVADTKHFATAVQPGPLDPALASLPEPRAVFTGAVVATKLDVALIVELAKRRPSWSFALVGPIGPGDPRTDVSALRSQPNIHLLGPRPYSSLPMVLRGAVVGLIPYVRNDLTHSIFPMKVYEYLSAGLHVVATPLPALVELAEVETAANAPAMAALLDAALADNDLRRRVERSRAAQSHSWCRRLEEISAALSRL